MKNQKGILLISSIFMVFFLGLIVSVSLIRSDIQHKAMDLRRASICGFYAAEAGIERAVFELRRDRSWRAGFNDESLFWKGEDEEQETIGFYTVYVADGEDVGSLPSVWLLSQGEDLGKGTPRFIMARVAIENPAVFFTSTAGNLTIGSGANIGGSILGRDVIFEVNETLPDDLKKITVDGDVGYIRSIEGEGNPAVDISGDVQQRRPVTYVSVDLEKYRALAIENGRYVDGDFTYSGEISSETLAANNGLVFVEGDIHISGEAVESIHFVSARNIYIDDDLTCEEEGEPQIGLSAHGDVLISEDASSQLDIDAFINADGGVFKAERGKASKKELNFEGAIAVRGKTGERTGVDLNAYIKRNYTYDTSLRDDLTIPYMSFMGNIIEWQELDYEQYLQELESTFEITPP